MNAECIIMSVLLKLQCFAKPQLPKIAMFIWLANPASSFVRLLTGMLSVFPHAFADISLGKGEWSQIIDGLGTSGIGGRTEAPVMKAKTWPSCTTTLFTSCVVSISPSKITFYPLLEHHYDFKALMG
jgi:hypothetical protein